MTEEPNIPEGTKVEESQEEVSLPQEIVVPSISKEELYQSIKKLEAMAEKARQRALAHQKKLEQFDLTKRAGVKLVQKALQKKVGR